AQVCGDVEREAVPGDPVARVNTYGCKLSLAGPHPGESRIPATREPVCVTRTNQGLLHLAEVPVQVLPVPLEVDDRIAHQLTRTVERDIAATFHLESLHASRCEYVRGGREMVCPGGPAQCHYRRMLNEEQDIFRYRSAASCLCQFALQLQRPGIRKGCYGCDQQLGHVQERTGCRDPAAGRMMYCPGGVRSL